MKRLLCISSTALAASLTMFGCDRESSVQSELEDLKEAQQESPEVAEELRQQLKEAKSEVVRLEEKLALAKQGVTDEVMEEREEVKEALKSGEQDVHEELKEARGAAAEHNAATDRAIEHLEKTQPEQRVEAQVNTETTAVPTTSDIEVTREQKQIAIEKSRLVEQNAASDDTNK